MKPFTHTDEQFLALLRRWVRGDIDRTGESELERSAAEDPFRQDAWDGFKTSPDTDYEAQLRALERRLQLRAGGAQSVNLYPKLLAAAAVIALLAVAFWLVPNVITQHEQAPVAQEQSENKSVAAAPAPVSDAAPQPSAPNAKRAQSGAPPSGAGAPLADVSASKEEKMSDDQGQGAVAYESQPAEIAPTAIRSEAAKPIVRKSDTLAAPGKMASAPEAESPVSASQPFGGWEALRARLAREARLPEAARNQNITGAVRLEFRIGPDGQPADINVVQGLGYGCDEAARRLIETTRWIAADSIPVQVDVWFRR